MDIAIEYIQKLLPLITFLAFPIVVVFCTIYIVKRSGNFSLLNNKIWSFFIGETKYFDNSLNELEQDEHDVARFNFKYNLNLKSKKQISSFINSTTKYSIERKFYNGLRRYFLPEIFKVTKPSKKHTIKIASNLIIEIILIFAFIAIKIITLYEGVGSNHTDIVISSYLILLLIAFYITATDLGYIIKANKIRKIIYQKINVHRKMRKP